MKSFKQYITEMDSRFGTPDDPRLNIHDPIWNRTSEYDPEHAKLMASSMTSDTDYVPPPTNTGGRYRTANAVPTVDSDEKTSSTFHSFKPMSDNEIFMKHGKELGLNSKQMVSYTKNQALERLMHGLANSPDIIRAFKSMIKGEKKD